MSLMPQKIVQTPLGALIAWTCGANHIGLRTFDDSYDDRRDFGGLADGEFVIRNIPHRLSHTHFKPEGGLAPGASWGVDGKLYLYRTDKSYPNDPTPSCVKKATEVLTEWVNLYVATPQGVAFLREGEERHLSDAVKSAQAVVTKANQTLAEAQELREQAVLAYEAFLCDGGMSPIDAANLAYEARRGL